MLQVQQRADVQISFEQMTKMMHLCLAGDAKGRRAARDRLWLGRVPPARTQLARAAVGVRTRITHRRGDGGLQRSEHCNDQEHVPHRRGRSPKPQSGTKPQVREASPNRMNPFSYSK